MRRPKLSDSAPCSGENRNCIKAHAVPNTPKIFAASCVSPPTKSTTSFGSTGMTTPIASMSNRTVAKMKMKAASRRTTPIFAFSSSMDPSISGASGRHRDWLWRAA